MSSKREKQHLCENMSLVAHEAFKRMRTNAIIALPEGENCKVIGITSAQPGEGKSTSTINLAYSFSELDKKVLLIDADLRRPSIGTKLDLTGKVGFGDLLMSANDLSTAIVQYNTASGKDGFDVIFGKSVDNASELLSSPRFAYLLDVLKKVYDYILIDLPPVDAVIDAVIAGKHTDGMIIIARENETLQKQFDNCVKQLEFANIKILGLVFNGSLEGVKKGYKYKYGYGYGY